MVHRRSLIDGSLTRLMRHEEIDSFYNTAEKLVGDLLQEVAQRDPVFDGYKMVLSGSTKEGVRVGNPYEVDYLVVYDGLQFETIKESPCNPGFLEVELKGDSLGKFEKFTIERQLNAGKLVFGFLLLAHEIVMQKSYREKEQHLRINGVKYVKDYQFFKKNSPSKLAESVERSCCDNGLYKLAAELENQEVDTRISPKLSPQGYHSDKKTYVTEFMHKGLSLNQKRNKLAGQTFTLHGPKGESSDDIPCTISENMYEPVRFPFYGAKVKNGGDIPYDITEELYEIINDDYIIKDELTYETTKPTETLYDNIETRDNSMRRRSKRAEQSFTLHSAKGKSGDLTEYHNKNCGIRDHFMRRRKNKRTGPIFTLHGAKGEHGKDIPLDITHYAHTVPPIYHENKVPNTAQTDPTNIEKKLEIPNKVAEYGYVQTTIAHEIPSAVTEYAPMTIDYEKESSNDETGQEFPVRRGLKPALMFSVRGLLKNREIGDIDVVLAFKLKSFWPNCANHWKTLELNISEAFRNKILEEGVLIVPKAPNSQKSSLRHFRFSFSLAESSLFEQFSCQQIHAYRILKISRQILFHKFKFGCLEIGQFIREKFVTYYLKSIALKVFTKPLKCANKVVIRNTRFWLVLLLEELIRCLDKGSVEHYFTGENLVNFDVYFEDVKEYCVSFTNFEDFRSSIQPCYQQDLDSLFVDLGLDVIIHLNLIIKMAF